MKDEEPKFKSDYVEDSKTTSKTVVVGRVYSPKETPGGSSQTISNKQGVMPSIADIDNKVVRYGNGKPRREIIRGKILS